MREIEFRAWEKNLKEIIPVDDINFKTNMINTSTAWRKFDEVELMQYTGIKDKNGVEIYEGDILTCDYYPFKDDGKPNYNAEVFWSEDSLQFCIQLHCVNPNKRGISDGMCEALMDRLDSNEKCEFEVIGNIYQEQIKDR
ncbi:MAG: YopX family protein [Peptostreptococcaceae bacterium]